MPRARRLLPPRRVGRPENSLTTILVVGAVLLGLLGVSYGIAHLHLGAWQPVIVLSIAAIQAGLVAVFYMHLRDSDPAPRMAALGGLVLLVVMAGLTLGDYFTRH